MPVEFVFMLCYQLVGINNPDKQIAFSTLTPPDLDFIALNNAVPAMPKQKRIASFRPSQNKKETDYSC